jgi:4a-hydroxytetrahydrobiopterin dehydratase
MVNLAQRVVLTVGGAAHTVTHEAEAKRVGLAGGRRPPILRGPSHGSSVVPFGVNASCFPGAGAQLARMPKPPPAKLSDAELAEALSKLPAWKLEAGKLHRQYKFADFVTAFGFMTSAALVAQAMDHHPEWFNVWSTVRVDLATHDSGGVTSLDVTLALAMEGLAARLLVQ